MTLGEYTDTHNLDFCDIILKDEEGKEIPSYGCLIQCADVVEVNGNVVVVR